MFEFKAQSVTRVNPLTFEVVGDTVVGLTCNIEVNYGGMGLSHQLDLWGELNQAQKEQAQAIYNFLVNRAKAVVLGD